MNVSIEHRSQRLLITKVCGVILANISNAIHTETETIFSVMQCFLKAPGHPLIEKPFCFFLPAQGPINGPEGIQEVLQGNAKADQPGQETAANGTYIHTQIHDLFVKAGYKWNRLEKKS